MANDIEQELLPELEEVPEVELGSVAGGAQIGPGSPLPKPLPPGWPLPMPVGFPPPRPPRPPGRPPQPRTR